MKMVDGWLLGGRRGIEFYIKKFEICKISIFNLKMVSNSKNNFKSGEEGFF